MTGSGQSRKGGGGVWPNTVLQGRGGHGLCVGVGDRVGLACVPTTAFETAAGRTAETLSGTLLVTTSRGLEVADPGGEVGHAFGVEVWADAEDNDANVAASMTTSKVTKRCLIERVGLMAPPGSRGIIGRHIA